MALINCISKQIISPIYHSGSVMHTFWNMKISLIPTNSSAFKRVVYEILNHVNMNLINKKTNPWSENQMPRNYIISMWFRPYNLYLYNYYYIITTQITFYFQEGTIFILFIIRWELCKLFRWHDLLERFIHINVSIFFPVVMKSG